MRGEFRRIYPNDGRQTFDGGKNSKYERAIIAPNESPDCLNVVFTDGAPETRPGYTKANTTSVGSFVCDGLYTRRADSGVETLCAFYGGHMFTLGTTTLTTVPSAQSVFTAGSRVGATNYENHLFMGNGGVIPYKYDGTDFTRHGVYPPTTTATVASNGVGALTASGNYQYKVTYVNSALVESDVGPVTSTFVISTTSGQNRLTSIPVAPQSWGVSARRIYRTSANGSTFKRVTELANNTTTTYDDNTADSALGVTAPTDNGVPPLYSFLIYHQTRLFMNDPANPDYLWYTNLGEPYTVASTNFIKVGDAAGDVVRAACVQDNSVIIFCDKSTWILYMPSTDATTWKLVKAKASFGSKSPFCALEYDNKALFVATQPGGKIAGFAAIVGDTTEPSASLLTTSTAAGETKSDRIEPDIFQIQESLLGQISGIVYQNQCLLSVPYGAGATANNRVYLMDFSMRNLSKSQKEAWAPWSGINAAQFAIYGGNLYWGSSTANGRLYRQTPSTYNDDGSAIDSYFWTKEFAGFDNEVNFQKDFRYANLLVETAGDYFMNLNYRIDSDSGSGNSKQVDLNPGGSLWGTMIWGVDNWGGGTAQGEIRVYLDGVRGKRIQFKFSNQNTVNQKFKVLGLNFAYNLKGYR